MARAREHIIAIPSRWGVECRNSLLIPSEQKGLLVILPGRNYSCDRPLFHLSRFAALQRNWAALSVEYGYSRAGADLAHDAVGSVVDESMAAVGKACELVEGPVVLLGKSLGTLVAGELSKSLEDWRKVFHIYLTPVQAAAPHILRTGGMVLAGDADGVFPTDEICGQLGGTAGVDLHFFPGANHSLEVPGDLGLTLSHLKKAIMLIDGYIANIGELPNSADVF
jgi:hypothetical protein